MEATTTPSSTLSIFAFTFKLNLKTVFNNLKDISLTNPMCDSVFEGMATELTFTNLSHSYEIGAEFSFIWKKVLKLFWKTIDIYESDECAVIKFEVYKTEPQTLFYFFFYKLFKDHLNKQTIMIMEMEYSIPIPFNLTEQEEYGKERYNMFKAIEKCITEKENEKTQTESIYIEADIQILAKIIFNLKILQKIVPIICDKVEYVADVVDVGTKMTLKWVGDKTSIVNLNVKTVFKGETFCKFVYECLEGDPPVPSQEIEWIIKKREGDFCIVRFTHYYKEVLNKNTLKYTSKLKKKILSSLKYQVEKGNRNCLKNTRGKSRECNEGNSLYNSKNNSLNNSSDEKFK